VYSSARVKAMLGSNAGMVRGRRGAIMVMIGILMPSQLGSLLGSTMAKWSPIRGSLAYFHKVRAVQ
jgi:hypothetical protein